MSKAKSKLTILVSSTVYGIEELLDRVYTLLTSYGYDVWMSHAGTVQTFSDRPAFVNCLEAVEKMRPLFRDHHTAVRKRSGQE